MSIFLDSATLADGAPLVAHSLTSGLGVQPGQLRADGIRCTAAASVSATIISEDESGLYPGVPTLVSGAGTSANPAVWRFDWDFVPELGMDAVLRFEEISANGASANVTISVLTSFEEEPNFIPIGPIGGGPLIYT